MELPFPLHKKHRNSTKGNWKKIGLHFESDLAFHVIYKRYIWSSHCELKKCNKEFESSKDRQMDHCHETGKFRAIVCNRCNQRRGDNKMRSHNTSGYRHISKLIRSCCRQGFTWRFQVRIDGVMTRIKSSVDLEWLVRFRDAWFEAHPDYHT